MNIADRWSEVQRRVASAAERSGRSPDEITIVAVSKTFPPDVIVRAVEAGVTDVGENRAQELKEKVSALGRLARWHFVGPLQSNKVRQVVGVDLIHSLDRLGLAEAIARRARSLGLVQDVLIQVNIAGEVTKHGIEPAALEHLADAASGMDGLRIKGLMTIPPATDDPEESRYYFKELAELGHRLRAALPDATELSMGMSDDVEVAIEEGATIVRVGRAIFGPRG